MSCSVGAQSSAQPRSGPRPCRSSARLRRSGPRRQSPGPCVPRDPCPTRSSHPGPTRCRRSSTSSSLMMENHSFDNYFGMLGRGDGFTLGTDGRPIDANPDADGNLRHAFHMPSSCQLNGIAEPELEREPHRRSTTVATTASCKASGPVAMGYWDERRHPLLLRARARRSRSCDRWFCSVLAQTYPNRRFLHRGHRRRASSAPSTAALARARAAERHDLRAARRARDLVAELLHRPAVGRRCSAASSRSTDGKLAKIEPVLHRRRRGHAARRSRSSIPNFRPRSPRRTRRTSASRRAVRGARSSTR